MLHVVRIGQLRFAASQKWGSIFIPMTWPEKRACFHQQEDYDRILEEHMETVHELDGFNQGQDCVPAEQEEEQPVPSSSSSPFNYFGVESSARMQLKMTARRRAIEAVLRIQDEQDLRACMATSLSLDEGEDDGDHRTDYYDDDDDDQREIADAYRVVGQTNEYHMVAHHRALRIHFDLLVNNE